MSTAADKVRQEFLKTGNVSVTARSLNLARGTVQYHLKKLGLLGLVRGRLQTQPSEVIKRPRRGRVKRFLFTALQNNTHIHPAHHNLLAYRDYLNRGDDTCELIVGSISYDTTTGQHSVKAGRRASKTPAFFAPELAPFIRDEPIEIGPGLLWGGNHTMLPTSVDPLMGLERYSGRRSLIVPHVKQHLRSVPSMAEEATKFLMTTGAATQRNYIQRRAGIIAEPEHIYGGLLVELDADGRWFCRHLVVDEEGHTYDVGPSWADGCVRVAQGKVTAGWRAGSLTPGDVHVNELWAWVNELTWGEGGIVDSIQPMHQFLHDIYTHARRSHHERKNFARRFELYLAGEESVEDELQAVAAFLGDAARDFCSTEIVHSNHDRHLDRWLDETRPDEDLLNAEFYHALRLRQIRALKAGTGETLLELALREMGVDERVQFLRPLRKRVTFHDHGGGIENSLHGDAGPNGARGTSRNLRHMARRVNKGHDHTAYLDQAGVASGGACALDFPYINGPTSHSVTHIVTFQNAARQLLTLHDGKWRA